jgi:hypothetical protein
MDLVFYSNMVWRQGQKIILGCIRMNTENVL